MKDDSEKLEKESLRHEKQAIAKAKKEARTQDVETKKKAKAKAMVKASNVARSCLASSVAKMPQPPPLLLNASMLQPFKTFDDVAKLKDAYTNGTWKSTVQSKPYVITNVDSMSRLFAKKTVAAAVGIFKVQLPDLDGCDSTGRASQIFQSDRRLRALELLRECVPQDRLGKIIKSMPGSLQQSLQVVHLFGCVENMPNVFIERNGLGTVRFQSAGKRDCVAMGWPAVKEYLEQKATKAAGFNDVENEGIEDRARRALLTITPEDVTDTMKPHMWQGVLQKGSIVVVPPACFVLERVIPLADISAMDRSTRRNSYVLGLRAH